MLHSAYHEAMDFDYVVIPVLIERALKLYSEDQCHQPSDADDVETDSLIRSGEETFHTGPYGTLPILIFSHDPAKVAAGGSDPGLRKDAGGPQEAFGAQS